MIEWLIDKARKKNQIKWHRIGKERLFASFGSTQYIITQLWIWHGLEQHITETTLFSPSSLFLFPQFFRLLIDYRETGKMSADCGEPGRLCLGWGGVRVREGGGREVYEGEFFCETVLAFLAIRPPASWITWDELSLALLDEYLVSTFFHGLLFTVIDYHVCVHKVHESCWWFPKLNNAMKSCC